MTEIVFYKELQGLPEELEKWCEKALEEIESPEKRDVAAKNLREEIEVLLKECPSQGSEEKTAYVLKKLGKAETAAAELKETYKIKNNKKTDKIIGIVCLCLGSICGAISLLLYYFSKDQVFYNNHGGYMQGAYNAGKGVGSAAVIAIFFIILGLRVLIYSKKEKE